MARILLVDDDRDIRELSRALLATAGHEVFTAESALPAIQVLQQNQIDVLISDVNMPNHTGFDLVRSIRRESRFANLSIAMLTGRRERKDIELALELGVHDYIVKPIDPHLFIQKVRDLVDRRLPVERTEMDFATAHLNTSVRAMVNVEIRTISEVGMVIRGAAPFAAGSRIDFDSDLFTKIGIQAPAMRVLSSVLTPGAEPSQAFETRVSFVGADEKTLTKIRAWIHSTLAKQSRGAS